jgi:hypothetical protein
VEISYKLTSHYCMVKVNIIIILIYVVAVGTALQLLLTPSPLFLVNHVLSFFFSLYLISITRKCEKKKYIYIYMNEMDNRILLL